MLRHEAALAERLRYLDAIEKLIGGDGIAPLLQHAPCGVKMSDLVRLTGQHSGAYSASGRAA